MQDTPEYDGAFRRTYAAAGVDRENRWAQIEAIGADAADAKIPPTGQAAQARAKEAMAAAGIDRADSTIETWCGVGAYMEKATAKQRNVFRRYAPTNIAKLHASGMSQADAYDFLKGHKRKSKSEICALTRANATPSGGAPKTLEDMARDVLSKYAAAFKAGAAFADAYESAKATSDVSAHAAMAYTIQQDQTQRQVDAAIHRALAGA